MTLKHCYECGNLYRGLDHCPACGQALNSPWKPLVALICMIGVGAVAIASMAVASLHKAP